ARRAARAAPDRGHPQGGQGHAPAQPTCAAAEYEAPGLRGGGASARGPETATLEARLMSEIAQYRGTGKRKTSIARVILRPGDGGTWINGRTIDDYFPRASHRTMVLAPLRG